jgi:hypothetical protein
MPHPQLDRVRCGGRNWLRPGDPCKLAGIDRDGERQAMPAKVRRILDEGGAIVVEVVIARPHRKAGTIRTVPLSRVRRVAVATARRKDVA